MNSKKISFSVLSATAIFLISIATVFSQTEANLPSGQNYEAVLHVVAGSTESGQGDKLPPSLAAISRKIRGDFGVTNLKLLNTYLGRLGNAGNLEYKDVSNAYSNGQENEAPTFLDWRLGSLNNSQAGLIQFQAFRFGARVPVRSMNSRDEAGKVSSVINYESIGLTLDKMSIPENVPTIVGTLSQPKTNATLFLILTVTNAAK